MGQIVRRLSLIFLAMLAAVLAFGFAAAFVPPTTLQPTRAVVSHVGEVSMAAKKPKPLSPGSNYPSTKNIQTQKSGFGNFLPKFEMVSTHAASPGPIGMRSFAALDVSDSPWMF